MIGDAAVPELYDLEADPSERFNLAEENPEIVARLRAQMAQLAREVKPGPAFDIAKLDPETAERRRAGRTPSADRKDGD